MCDLGYKYNYYNIIKYNNIMGHRYNLHVIQ